MLRSVETKGLTNWNLEQSNMCPKHYPVFSQVLFCIDFSQHQFALNEDLHWQCLAKARMIPVMTSTWRNIPSHGAPEISSRFERSPWDHLGITWVSIGVVKFLNSTYSKMGPHGPHLGLHFGDDDCFTTWKPGARPIHWVCPRISCQHPVVDPNFSQ